MTSTLMSSASYLNYLNDYIDLLLNNSDRYLLEHLNETYLDEIEGQARCILVQWHSEELIDKQSSLYIENVGYLNRKILSLTTIYRLNQIEFERIENLLLNTENIQLVTVIIQSILETNQRHKDNFLRYLSIYLDAFSLMRSSKEIFEKIIHQAIQSKYYKQYLTESMSSIIEPIHLFFIGSIGQFTLSLDDSTLNELYSQFIITFYNQTNVPDDADLHYCTLGVLSQLQISSLINDYSCISTLVSICSAKFEGENTKIFLLPILNLLNSICVLSKTVACYLNTDQFIDILLQYVTNQNDYSVHISACLLLGHIISEKQLIQLRISYKLTMKCMDLLLYPKRDINEILNCILSLAVHEQIQLVIVHAFQLGNFIKLTERYPVAYEIIWKLSFHSDIVEQLITRHDDFLKQLSTVPTANGILQNVQMKNLSRIATTTNGIGFNVSLISSPKDRIIVQQIEENLVKRGLRVGTTLNSHSLLLCISEELKHDCTCQAAVRQALLECKKVILCTVQKPYRIDDWLGTLNTQEKKLLNAVELGVERMLSEIQKDILSNHHLPVITKRTRIVTPSQRTFILPSSPPPLPPIATSMVVSPNVPKRKIQTWTNREVLDWCDSHKLNAFTKILTLYDGRSLLALAHVSRMSAPHTIINQLRNDCRKQGLKVSFVEFVRFQTALDEVLRLEQLIARKQSVSTIATRYVYKGKPTNQT
jgi:hypothetical protein